MGAGAASWLTGGRPCEAGPGSLRRHVIQWTWRYESHAGAAVLAGNCSAWTRRNPAGAARGRRSWRWTRCKRWRSRRPAARARSTPRSMPRWRSCPAAPSRTARCSPVRGPNPNPSITRSAACRTRGRDALRVLSVRLLPSNPVRDKDVSRRPLHPRGGVRSRLEIYSLCTERSAAPRRRGCPGTACARGRTGARR